MAAVLDFHDNLHTEILSWLPVKSLMRLRCVSATWNSLILHPTFVDLHLQRSPKKTQVLIMFCINLTTSADDIKICIGVAPRSIRFLLENQLYTLEDISFLLRYEQEALLDDFYPLLNSSSFILGVCNGLICARFGWWEGEDEVYWVRFLNPATRIMSEDSPRLRVNSCNDGTEYDVKHGFGYDDSSQTYKVVAIIFDLISMIWEIKVYCKGTDFWRRVLTGSSALPILQDENGAFVSGTLNWLALRISVSTDPLMVNVTNNGSQSVIFSFDLKQERYRYLSIPDRLSEVSQDKFYLGVLSGCLCLSHDHEGTYFVVWLMRDFEANSWTQLLKVNYAHLQAPSPPLFSPLPLFMSETGDLPLLTDRGRAHFVLPDQDDNNRVNHIGSFKSEFNFNSTFLSFDYVESLVSPY